jgi:chorismate synthase
VIRYLTSGESHGKALTVIVEGVPAGVTIETQYINHQLWRRQQGFGRGKRMKIERDEIEILSGVRFGKTLGSPITMLIKNRDWENWQTRMSVDGDGIDIQKITIPRPGHADHAGLVKYEFDDIRNVIDRASARETAARVAGCTVIRKFLEDIGIFVGSHVISIGSVALKNRANVDVIMKRFTKAACGAYKITEQADRSEVRMLDKALSKKAMQAISRTQKDGDTLGGIVELIVTGTPVGLGSYVHYDRRLDGQLAQALMSVQGVKAVEIGDGFANAVKRGSEVHDSFVLNDGNIRRATNRAGGIEGGMTNGEILVMRAAMKPISTLIKPLESFDIVTKTKVKSRYERSDICAVPACSVVCEAAIVPVLANAALEKFGGDSLAEILPRVKKLREQ